MIVENVPDFLCPPSDYGTFHFDKAGRFIYTWRYKDVKDIPQITIYDIIFNSYIKLTGDTSITSLQLVPGQYNRISIRALLPVDGEQFLLVHENHAHSHVLYLMSCNFERKTYGILDRISMDNCEDPTLVRDDDSFGLFYRTRVGGDLDYGPDSNKRVLWTFNIQANRLQMDETKKMFNYQPENFNCEPHELHLRRGKLWFFHRKDVPLQMALPDRPGQPPRPPPDPNEKNLMISYFDLNEQCPRERNIDEIKLGSSCITSLQWVQDTLLLRLDKPAFDVLDLQTNVWKLDAVECSQFPCEMSEDGEWVEFEHNELDSSVFWNQFSCLHIDQQYFLVAVNRKSSSLHRIALRNPPQLLDIAWTSSLNAGLFNTDVQLSMKLPYSRMF